MSKLLGNETCRDDFIILNDVHRMTAHYPSTQPGHPDEAELTVLAKFAMQFCVTTFVRSRRNALGAVDVEGGGGVLLMIGGKKRLVTAHHVVQEYRNAYIRDGGTLFTCMTTNFNPNGRIIGEDATSDIVVIDVDDLMFERNDPDLPALEFFTPIPWPGNDVVEGDRVFLGGWPGAYRVVTENGLNVRSGYDAILNVPVTLKTDHEFSMKFERTEWKSFVVNPDQKPPNYIDARRLGGHSGTGVFRISPTGERPELVGFVKQYYEDRDTIVCCPVTKIRGDGTVKPSSIGYTP